MFLKSPDGYRRAQSPEREEIERRNPNKIHPSKCLKCGRINLGCIAREELQAELQECCRFQLRSK